MGTIYRKVQFEINCKDHDETWLIGKSANFIFNPNTRNGEELEDFLSCCEEITDTSQQIEKLEAEKKELLEALENLMEYGSTGEDAVEMKKEIESLIQKMKKCQENTPR